jgi:hypothetical protein
VRKLPARLSDHLIESRWHSFDQRTEPQLLAHLTCLAKVVIRMRMRTAEQQVERERCRQDVVLVALRHHCNTSSPGSLSTGWQIESAGEDDAGCRPPRAGEQRRERRFAAAGFAFEQDRVAFRQLEGACLARRRRPSSVRERQVPTLKKGGLGGGFGRTITLRHAAFVRRRCGGKRGLHAVPCDQRRCNSRDAERQTLERVGCKQNDAQRDRPLGRRTLRGHERGRERGERRQHVCTRQEPFKHRGCSIERCG